LKGEGYEILTAGNGKEAIQQLEAGRPDLIILDIVMPVMDGMKHWAGLSARRGRSPSSLIPLIQATNRIS